jgi:hypothetical protein
VQIQFADAVKKITSFKKKHFTVTSKIEP